MSDPYRDSQASSHEGIWHSLNKFLLTLIVLSIAIPIAYSFMPEVKKRKVDEAKIEELKGQVEHQRMMLARLQREESLLKHDPEYIGLVARDRLDLMKEGETIYRVDAVKVDTSKFRLNP